MTSDVCRERDGLVRTTFIILGKTDGWIKSKSRVEIERERLRLCVCVS